MADTDRPDSTLGPWAGDDLSSTAKANAGIGADSDLPLEVRFIAGVAKLLRRRLAEAGQEMDPVRPAIFLLEPNARTHKPDTQPKRVPMLDNGLTTVTGRLWFVNATVVVGKYLELDQVDDDELFLIVTECLRLGEVPTVVFDPRPSLPEARFYPRGLADATKYNKLRISGCEITLEDIFQVVERIYKERLITPEAQPPAGKLWKDQRKWWASDEAEAMIQLYLSIGLTAAFPTCTIRHEQSDTPGRLDLEVEEADVDNRSRVTRHAILELKVLRSFGSTGIAESEQYTLDWVTSGVKQAATYRDRRGALAASLCCFDMRKEHTGDRCFHHVRELGKDLNVTLHVWFIFATSKHYRDFLTNRN
jgi:hypothetical protein